MRAKLEQEYGRRSLLLRRAFCGVLVALIALDPGDLAGRLVEFLPFAGSTEENESKDEASYPEHSLVARRASQQRLQRPQAHRDSFLPLVRASHAWIPGHGRPSPVLAGVMQRVSPLRC